MGVISAFVLTIGTAGLALFIAVPLGLLYFAFWLTSIVSASSHANRGEEYRYALGLRLLS